MGRLGVETVVRLSDNTRSCLIRPPVGSLPLAADELLDDPAVAVRIAEEQEPAPGKVLYLSYVQYSIEQIGARDIDVLDHQLQPLGAAGC